jgi:hypothetical protein
VYFARLRSRLGVVCGWFDVFASIVHSCCANGPAQISVDPTGYSPSRDARTRVTGKHVDNEWSLE